MNMQLYSHQKAIIEADPKKCGLFLGTGGGKTRIALSLARGNVLIIMPKTQFLDENWARERAKLETKNITPRFISKEQFKKEHATLPYFETVIIDEAHTILGVTPNVRYRDRVAIPKTSQIFEAVHSYFKRTNPDRIYLCTATPARNPMSIWGAGILLGKKWDWYKWRNMFYFKLPMNGREIFQAKKDTRSKELLARQTKSLGYIGRLSDWFDVPEQTIKTIHCPLNKEQEQRIKELPLEFPDPLVLIGKVHQVEQGEGKLEEIENILSEFPKVIVFAKYRAQIESIKEYFDKEIDVYTLTGDIKNRKEVIYNAEKSEQCLFIAQSQVSAGYELPSFRCMIFASMSYSFVDYTQACGRNLRANALSKNLYVFLQSGNIDSAVLECMKGHKDFSELLYEKERSKVPNRI